MVGQHCILVRVAVAVANRHNHVMLGGPGEVVYVDMVYVLSLLCVCL